ncbi:MAG: type IV pilus assembly protein PilM [Planctomycetota bacterium]
MAKKNEAWGIDVGANAVKAVKLVRNAGGVAVEDFAVLPFKQVLTTPDLDVDQAIQVQLETLMQKHEIDKTQVVVSVPGNMAFARFAKLPPVEPKKIPDIVKFEAQQQIPFPIEQVEWDYQVFQQEDMPDVEVGIFAITKERVMSYLNNYRAVDMKVDSLTLSPLGVYNLFHHESPGEGAIYMDIGTVSTDVIIVEDGGIWLRTLPIGGNNFTEALVKQFKISFPKAEKLKREAATSKYAKQIFQAMRAVFADLVQEVQRSLGFYQSLNRDSNLTKLVGVGSTFRLPGLQKFLKQQLQIDVVRPDGFENLPVLDGKRESEFANHALNMATAAGLALQGLGLEKVSANILPSHVLAARMWKAKQPWIAASAACFVMAAGLVGVKHFSDASIIDSQLAEMEREVRPILSDANAQVAAWTEIQQDSDPRQFIKNLRRTLDHRNVWPRLIEDISNAVLAMQPQEALLGTDYAAQAEIPRNRRQRVHIESIVPRYESRLGGSQAAASAPSNPSELVAKNYTAEEFFTSDSAPAFVITLTGTTPLATADAQLNAKLIQWFRDNAEREDRPYRFVFTEGENPITELRRVIANSTRDRFGRTQRLSQLGGGQLDPFGGFDSGFRGGSGFSSGRRQAADVDGLIPERPMSEEERSDWQFVIEIEVELKAPLEARPKVDTTPSRPTPESAPSSAETVPDSATASTLAQAPLNAEGNR